MVSGDASYVPVPDALRQPLSVPFKTLCGPGPTNMSQRVLNSMQLPLMGHFDKDFFTIMDEIRAGIQYVFQTKNQCSFALSGTGHAGLECCMTNLVERGDNVAVVKSGLWGQRCQELVRRLGGNPCLIEAPYLGSGVTEETVEKVMREHAPKVLYVAQGESSAGVLEDVQMIARVCEKYGCLAVVDTVASLGGVPFLMDEWKVDCVFTGSQKVLASPPGSALVSFSPKAVEKFRNRKEPVPSYLFDLALNANYWNIEGFGTRAYHYTAAVLSFYALRESLGSVCDEGLVACQQRHQRAANYLHKKLAEELKLELFVKEEKFRLPTVNAVVIPEGIDGAKVSAFVMNEYKLEVAGGLGPSKGLIWRVGLMGPNATEEKVDFIVNSLKLAIQNQTASKL